MLRKSRICLTLCMVCLGAILQAASHDDPKIAPLPTVKVKFYNAEEVQALSEITSNKSLESGHNKLVIELSHFPKEQEIIWEVKRLSDQDPDSFRPHMKFVIQPDGSYLTEDQKSSKTLSYTSKTYLPGERASFRFRTADNRISKDVVGIPNPAFFKDKNGKIALSAELVHLKPTVYIIDMPALEEGEIYDLKTVILGVTSTVKKAKFTRNTPFHFTPTAKKGKGGDSYFEVQRKSGDIYFLKLPWGTAIENYTKEKRIHIQN